METRKEMKQTVVKVRGVVNFPYWDNEENKYSVKLMLNEKEIEKIAQICSDNDMFEPSFGEDEDGINVKTSYQVPIFYEKEDMYDETKSYSDKYFVRKGDEVIAIVQLKEFIYKRKHGTTCYLKGMKVVKLNEEEHKKTYVRTEVTLADFEDEDLAF